MGQRRPQLFQDAERYGDQPVAGSCSQLVGRFDSCRRIDYCINGDHNAAAYVAAISAFYASKATATSLAMISDGYTTTGANPTGTLGDYAAGMAFLGPAGVGAMAAATANPSYDSLMNLSYLYMKADMTGAQMKVSGTFSYFNASWGVLSLLAMSGNFWDMTQ